VPDPEALIRRLEKAGVQLRKLNDKREDLRGRAGRDSSAGDDRVDFISTPSPTTKS
jgi:hypothetical protein